MFRGTRVGWMAAWAIVFCLGACSPDNGTSQTGEVPLAPEMPAHWTVTSDFRVPVEQVKKMSKKLGANLSNVRNTVYDVQGTRVQINVIVTPDSGNAEMLMTKLRSIKVEEALLRKDLIVYEFVGKNDVLRQVAEGRRPLDSK